MKTKHTVNAAETSRTVFGTNQHNLLALFKASPLGIIAIDLDGKIRLWNRAAEELTGWREEELLGLPIQVVAAEKWEDYEVLRRRTANREMFHSLPMEATRKDGRRIIISYSSAPVFDGDRVVATMGVIYDITEKITLETALKDSLEKMGRVVDETVNALAAAIEKRDPYTAGHQRRVAELACAIAGTMGDFDYDRMKGLKTAAIIHDIGKLYVPIEILSKPGQLTELEFGLIKTHPQAGYEILREIEFPWPIAEIVHQHHERLDGSGYPSGLAGNEILMEAYIVGVADVVEAMSSHRPYRPALGRDLALQHIQYLRGIAYDSCVVDACLELFKRGHMGWILMIALLVIAPCPVDAQELFGLGGIVQSSNAGTDDSSASWQLEYREGLGEHFASSISYLNEGHVPAHHRDGHAVQLWTRADVLDRQLSLSAGIGPYYYFDTTIPATSRGSFTNEHGFGGAFSLAAIWQAQPPWLFQVRTNWVKTFGRMDTVSALAGIGYQLDAPRPSESSVSPPELRKKTTDNEITLFVGRTITNSFESERSTSLGVEYRRGLWRYVDWTVSWIYEGDSRLIRRDGLASQLWAVKAFSNDRIALGVGSGAYVAIDRHPDRGQDGHRSISAIATFTGSYRLHEHWCLRTSWNRIVTDYDRDTDVILGGIGYRF